MATTDMRPGLAEKTQQSEITEEERAAFFERLAWAQEEVRKLVPPGRSLTDELIAEHRAEAALEESAWSQAS